MSPQRGRRTGGKDTRAQILVAARELFGENGYAATTMRAIAQRAGVDAALIHHHFGSKEALFRAVMQISFDPAAIAAIISGSESTSLGERLCLYFLELWEDAATREPLLAILRSALTQDAAAETLRQFISTAVVGRVASFLMPQMLRCAPRWSAVSLSVSRWRDTCFASNRWHPPTAQPSRPGSRQRSSGI